jgi:16S rRNA (guanine966-N2)-methyltransferase
VRVVAGSARGRPLRAPPGDRVRPTADRVREATFNALGSLGLVEGARVLDLFAGTGALGIEALSRGADRACFVDHDARSLAVVRANLAATGLAERATVVRAEALSWLAAGPGPPSWLAAGPGPPGPGPELPGPGPEPDPGNSGASFDLALVDPPYRFDRWPELLALLPTTWAVAESDRPVPEVPGWGQVRSRRYGATVTTFLRRSGGDHHGKE